MAAAGILAGCTLWQLVGAGMLLHLGSPASAIWFAAFLVSLAVAAIFWRLRHSIGLPLAFDLFMGWMALAGLACIASADAAGDLDRLTLGPPPPRLAAYASLLVFPLLPVLFHLQNRPLRRP